ncbi:MAG TPA: PUA domain-containing protein [Nitrososphaera sp.]|nr:PUA domain-containing protein [Nitrososphaera sp.]
MGKKIEGNQYPAFRPPDRAERTALNRAFNNWGVFEEMRDFEILIKAVGSRTFVHVVSKELSKIAPPLRTVHFGLEIGELSKRFLPNIAGADLFARLDGSKRQPTRYLTVSREAENLVLYGRDVLGESIVNASAGLKENELVILLNPEGEGIGIGRTRVQGNRLKEAGTATVTTIADAGQYLRDEGA